jgi:REP element-mobilizing transposase RayT
MNLKRAGFNEIRGGSLLAHKIPGFFSLAGALFFLRLPLMSHPHRFKSKHNAAIYHCISRTISGEMLFDDKAKEIMRKHLHQAAEFSGVKIVTYAMMGNHFHVLVKVEEQKDVPNAELLRRYKVLYPEPNEWNKTHIAVMEATFEAGGADAEQLRAQLLARMGDVSEFMKTFKQRFTIWFNRNHNRFGPLWAERFTSTIIEGALNHHSALQMVAAYMDLNPVRAGLVRDPKDYRWCGYAEAEAGSTTLVEGLRLAASVAPEHDATKVLATYRVGLFGKGTAPKRGDSKAARISDAAYQRVLQADGHLSDEERQLIQTRIPHFTRGAVIGSESFVQEHLDDYRTTRNKRRHMPPKTFPSSDTFSMRGGN